MLRWLRSVRGTRLLPPPGEDHVWLWIHAAAFGMTVMFMVAGIRVHPHYLIVLYPLNFVWLAWVLLGFGDRRAYVLVLALQLFVTVTLLAHIHRDGGRVGSEYGVTYREQQRQ